jgi:large subunit ribosomal protein L29
MKASELRQKGNEELNTLLFDLMKEQFSLRMQRGTGQLSHPSRLRMVRRDIARIRTVMREKFGEGA